MEVVKVDKALSHRDELTANTAACWDKHRGFWVFIISYNQLH